MLHSQTLGVELRRFVLHFCESCGPQEYVNLTKNDVVAPSLNTMVDEHKLVADPQDTGGN